MDNTGILNELVSISIDLSKEKDTQALLEHILLAAKRLSNADGGTIYSVNNQQQLVFDTLFNDSLNLHLGGSSQQPADFQPIPIFIDGEPNTQAAVAHAAATGDIINIDDLSASSDYHQSRAKAMDEHYGYQTHSVLTIPMQNHEQDLIGVLQLVNAKQGEQVIPFDQANVKRVQALASLASVALTNRQLIDAMEELFQSFTRLIAKAIDEKSPYTGGHCRRVPELTMMIAEAVHRHNQGPMKDFAMTEADRHELNLAGWIHDCGKVATPEYVMDKSKKLETIFDRIQLVETRFALHKKDLQLKFTQKMLAEPDNREQLEKALAQQLAKLEDDLAFVQQANTGGEFMTPEDQARLDAIAAHATVDVNGSPQPLLSEDEVYNLRIARGTLNNEERATINRHMNITIEMLESLPFPKHLQRVPEFAGGHHEKMDGTGYPKGLTREQMSIPARVMAIADIFEALTAADRPYKEAKKISECLTIMGRMKLGNHIDPDLFDIFVKEKVYLEYAQKFLKPEQIDPVDLASIPGFDAD